MRNIIILSALVLSMTFTSELYAQSGSRGGGGSRSSGGSRVRSSGGSRPSLSSSRGRVRQPSPAELERLAKQQQQEAQRLAKLQGEYSREQFRQTLVQLALRENRSANARQLREAFREAERDYKRLRSGNLTPEQAGVLQVPFRLSDKDIDRSSGTIQWPEALRADQFTELTDSLDKTVAGGVDSDETAKQFFNELKTLNTAVNEAVVSKEIKSSNYAKARRFITGLANEVRATEYGDVVLAKQ